jgi:hypothetical protein
MAGRRNLPSARAMARAMAQTMDGHAGLRMNRARRLLASACAAVLVCGLSAASARADERPLARVVLMPELIPEVARQLLPMTIELAAGRVGPRATRIKVVGLVYCGGDGGRGAWALLAGYPDGAAAGKPDRTPAGSNVLSAADCRAALPGVAQRLAHSANAADWVEVIKTHVTWTPWTLRLAVADAAGASRNGSPAPPLKKLGQFKSFPTSNLHLLPPPGQENRFDVAVGFSESSIVVAVFPAGRVGNPGPYLNGDPVLDAEMADAPARANAVADAQYGFINALLRLYASSFEIPLQLQGMTQRLIARNVSASGGDNTMTVTGQLELGNVSYDAAVHCEGDDLAIRQVTLVGPAIKCDNNNVIAQLQCQSQQAASGALGPVLTNIYQGQRFHYSTVDRPLHFTLGDATFAARFEALRSSSRGSTVNEDGNVTIERIERAPAPVR